MRAISKTDLEIGNSDLAIAVYSAIETETSFKQFSKCCDASVKYNKVCRGCDKILSTDEIYKALEVGETINPIDTEELKAENGNLKILGVVNDDIEQGIFQDGTTWFISYDNDKKNKSKTKRNLMKFSYFRDSLRESQKTFIGLISVRGKEKIVILKPYFNGLVALGCYHFNRLRDINEISGVNDKHLVDEKIVKQMSDKILGKEKIAIKDIENKRDELIETQLSNEVKTKVNKDYVEENPLELMNF